jgi:type I restriction enzyme S subunit
LPVRDIAEFLRGVTYKKAEARETPAYGFLPILRATNIQDDRLVLDSELVYVPEQKVKPEQRLKPGDVVVCTSSGSKHLVGKTAQLTREWEGSFGAFCGTVRFRPEIDQRFAGYFFGSPGYRNLVRERSSGVNINNLRRGDIETLLFPIPPIAEQHRIALEIETQFTRLAAGVAALKRAQANLRRYKASVLKAACEGRLVPTESKLARAEGRDYEPADILLERILAERRAKWEAEHPRKKYKEPKPPDTSDLPKLPEGWAWAAVAQVGEVRLGRQRSPRYHQGPHMRPYLRAANATWDGVDLSDIMEMDFPPRVFETYRLKKGDVLLSEASGSPDEVGKPFVWHEEIPDCCFQNTLIRVRLDGLPSSFVYVHFLKDARTGRFAQLSRGVGIHHLGSTRLAVFPIAIPPLNEQNRIVAEVERRLSVVEELEKQVEAALRRAERLRQAILKHAFEGKLVPQDPNDEPASALLARVKAERSGQAG